MSVRYLRYLWPIGKLKKSRENWEVVAFPCMGAGSGPSFNLLGISRDGQMRQGWIRDTSILAGLETMRPHTNI